ncbi:MAG: amidohydrolase family protein [Acidobacteriota bacterium]
MRMPWVSILLVASAGFSAAQPLRLRDIAPVDAHAHVYADDPHIKAMLERQNMRIVNLTCVDPYDRGFETWPPQHQAMLAVARGAKGRAPWVATFEATDWEEPGFSARVIKDLDQAFREGAVGVKFYKTIGMYYRSKDGRYVMPDDPAFSPILDAIEARGKTVYAHFAEPNGAWKPFDPADPDSSYYRDNPAWHMYGHPERPPKQVILAARDRMLAAHLGLRVIGCHLGSMEDNVDEVARRLDRFPNFAVDTAARVTHLALQPREKVRAFLLKYQDRVLYATDDGLVPGGDGAASAKRWEADLERDWKFFATAEKVEYMGKPVQGLALPEPVLRKIFHDNVAKWVK